MKKLAPLLVCSCCLGSCVILGGEAPVNEGLAYFQVDFATGTELGAKEDPLPLQEEHSFTVAIEARDYEGELIPSYSGVVELRMLGSKVITVSRVEILEGRAAEVGVTLRYGAGREAISVHEVEPWTSPEGTTGWRDTGKLGVSESIYLPPATIPMIQGVHDGNARNGFLSRYNNRNLNLTGTEFVVLAVIEGGMYLRDPTAPEYGSIYLYTYSTPYVDDVSENDVNTYHALVPGSIITDINGSVFEFFGFTEMSFPTYEPKRARNGAVWVDASRIPAPEDITAFLDAGEDEELEKHESSLVTVTDVVVDDFDENEESFVEYYQFPLKREGTGRYIMATTLSTAPAFSPTANRGTRLSRMTGILKQHRSARPSTWILVPRNLDDIVISQ